MTDYYVRNTEPDDLPELIHLARQILLFHLPADPDQLTRKIERSIDSFTSPKPIKQGLYLFSIVESATGRVVGTSHILSCYVSPEDPLYHFDIENVENGREGQPLQYFRVGVDTGNKSSIGGLVLDKKLRRHPLKLGKTISAIRFLYMGMHPERFQTNVFSELLAPLDEQGNNLFWEDLGRGYTGLSYPEALECYRKGDLSFMDAFPKSPIPIYAETPTLIRTRENVRLSGRGEQHIVEQAGFKFQNRIDPMDGGLRYEARVKDLQLVKKGQYMRAQKGELDENEESNCLIGVSHKDGFRGGRFTARCNSNRVYLSSSAHDILKIKENEAVYVTPFH